MDQLTKWILLFAALMLTIDATHAWTIGSKGRVNGPTIHTTYFLTSNNAPFPVHAQAYVGYFINNNCQYNAIYDLGTDTLKTGDFVDIDAFLLKSIMGTSYTCITIYYTSKELVMETFELQFDGVNYTSSLPLTSEVNIL